MDVMCAQQRRQHPDSPGAMHGLDAPGASIALWDRGVTDEGARQAQVHPCGGKGPKTAGRGHDWTVPKLYSSDECNVVDL
jgi:hypothetical protein